MWKENVYGQKICKWQTGSCDFTLYQTEYIKKTLQYVKIKCKKYHKLVAYKYKCVYYVYNTK